MSTVTIARRCAGLAGRRPAPGLVLPARAGLLGVIAPLWALDALAPLVCVPLLAFVAHGDLGNAGEYTMLSELGARTAGSPSSRWPARRSRSR
jgi:hypothetical protein